MKIRHAVGVFLKDNSNQFLILRNSRKIIRGEKIIEEEIT